LLILIILGFVVFVLWSILFHSVSEEWSKRDILNVIRKKIEAKRELLEALISEIESLQKQISEKKGMISSLQLDLNKFKFKVSDIEHSILQFTKGWIRFLSAAPNPNETLKNEIQMIKDEFIMKLKTSNEL
jgi:peptidoglycan hydrolase CwlO-like protein